MQGARGSTRVEAQSAKERRREAVKLVKKLSQKFRSMALAQLAQELSEVDRTGVGAGADPFTTTW